MSRAYEIRISENIVETIHVEDGVQSRIELLPIVSKDETAELLRTALQRRGYTGEGHELSKQVGDVEVTVNVEDGTLTARIAKESKLEKEITRSARTYDQQRGEAALKERVAAAKEREIEAAKERLTDELASKLESELKNLKKEMDDISGEVTREGLKRKASRLGEVQEVSENPESGELTIRVKV